MPVTGQDASFSVYATAGQRMAGSFAQLMLGLEHE